MAQTRDYSELSKPGAYMAQVVRRRKQVDITICAATLQNKYNYRYFITKASLVKTLNKRNSKLKIEAVSKILHNK